jgi:hypothetical protein
MRLSDIEGEVRDAKLRARLPGLDLLLAAIGQEIADLFTIALALAILCAPWAFGLGVTWAVAEWSYALSHRALPGYLLGAITFVFFCRYVWGARLSRATRRAAEALIAGK